MGKCNACGLVHPRPGDKSCKYQKQAIEKCKSLGANEEDWRLYLDEEMAARETDIVLETAPVVKHESGDIMTELQQQRTDVNGLMKSVSEITGQLKKLMQVTSNIATVSGAGVPVSLPGPPGPDAASLPGGAPTTLTPPTPLPKVSTSGVSTPVSSTFSSGTGMVPAAASLVSTPLTAALQQLTSAIDPEAATKSAGIGLRPEFYVQYKDNNVQIRNLDHKKLSYRELIYGMCCVAKHVKLSGGDLDSYLDHMTFVCKTAQSELYQDVAFADYDKFVVDRVVNGISKSFVPQDAIGFTSHFHAAMLNLDKQAELLAASHGGRGSYHNTRRGRRGRRGAGQRGSSSMSSSVEVLDDYPEDNCYWWNYRKCTLQNCPKEHVCRICRQRHKAVGCPKDKQN